MPVALTLLGEVRWRGAVVVGPRPQALLAALASGGGRPVSDERLVELVWGEEAPSNSRKSLQVLVSRTRTACGPDAIVRDRTGYRLGLDPAEVDSLQLASLVREARAALDSDAIGARVLARDALALAHQLPPQVGGGDGILMEIRRSAVDDVAAARAVSAQLSSRFGAHVEALPELEAAFADSPADESLLVDLLRSEGVMRGPSAALERYEEYRRDLRERLGTSPGEPLQRMQRELLAFDRPTRQGLRFEATALLGRERDVDALRGLLASARVVSIVGAGGLGKTRLAHVLARDARQPLVHVVELVGVTAADDVVAEVGSALGVRDSLSARHTLTRQQRADLRSGIAQRLAGPPSLLVLDNCEHLVEAVAELVAFLVSHTAELRVLTTSRSPLAIAAERVYLLGELDHEDAAELFRERALAARPDVQLVDEVVHSIVARLDGLPLAIELAAAKVRAMAVEEIGRRLEHRFALLRGGDRSAPDRHRTLLAVIDWSWNLLGALERRALRRLALFNDGFTLEAAEAVLGDAALDAVQGLVDQSLLSVREAGGGLRYRMLETVREFGRMQLVEAGDDDDARAARRSWAVGFAGRHGASLIGPDQFAAVDAVAAEETNLADELRDAIADGDLGAIVELMATLGFLWTVRGEHPRAFMLVGAVADAVDGWSPPAELEDVARAAMAITLTNAMMASDERSGPIRELLARLGPGGDARLAGPVRVLLEFGASDAAPLDARLERLAQDPDPLVVRPACQWLSHLRENAGDPTGAADAAERALALRGTDEGPWAAAMLHNQLAGLTMHLGDRAAAVAHALAALPVMERLGAKDDEVQLRSGLALCAIADGRLDDAEAELERIAEVDDGEVFGGLAIRQIGAAELALARGDHRGGLRAYRECATRMSELRFPGVPATGLEPWVVFGESTALAAHAHYATGTEVACGTELYVRTRARALRLFDPRDPYIDCPVAGLALFGLGVWGLLHEATPVGHAVELLALAERLAYSRAIPTLAWERIEPAAETLLPGQISALRAGYGDRRPRELLDDARELVARVVEPHR